jgi:membrane protein YdbS with pleckstrin-like domain
MNSNGTIAGEKAVLMLNEHWIKYVMSFFLVFVSWLLYALCLSLSIAVIPQNHIASMVIVVVGHVLLLFFHHAAFYHFFSVGTWRTLITNRRILTSRQRLWFSDDIIDTPLWRVRSVEVKKKGILQHILDYGTIVLNRGDLPSIERVPHPYDAHTSIVVQIQEMQPALEKKRSVSDHQIPSMQT